MLLIKMGYFIRGGISIGKSWSDINNIVGSAYVEAYAIESKEAEYPCIMLSDQASKIWDKVVGKRKTEGRWEALCFKTAEKDNYYVDISHYPYMREPSLDKCIDGILKKYRRFYDESIDNLKKTYNENGEKYNKIRIERRKEWFEGYAEERKKRNWYDLLEPLNI